MVDLDWFVDGRMLNFIIKLGEFFGGESGKGINLFLDGIAPPLTVISHVTTSRAINKL